MRTTLLTLAFSLSFIIVPSSFAASVCVSANEWSTASLACPAGERITSIEYANYGQSNGSCGSYSLGSCRAANTLSVVQSACLNQSNCSLASNNNVFGDPCPGIGKRLVVQAFCSPINPPSPPVCATANEWANMTLTCPAGQTVTSIDFASFGQPTGSCGSFVQGSCHAANSTTLVQSACLGKASCTLSSSIGTFGDPCPGLGKRLSVQLRCGNGSTPSPSPSPSPTPTPSPSPTSPPGAGIIFYDGAEKAPTINYGPQPPTYWSGAPGHPSVGTLTVDTTVRRRGNSSYKIVLKNNGTTNTPYEYLKKELAWNFLPSGTNAATAQQLGQPDATNRPLLNLRWIAMSIFVPTNFQDNTQANGFGIGFNTKAIPDDYPTPMHIYMYNGRYVIMLNNGVNAAKQFDLGPVQRGVWTDFVVNRNFTSSANGFVRVYRNGQLVAESLGNNWRDGPGYAKEPYVQMGAYQFQWNNPNPITERVIYIDELRFGNDRATLQDFLID